MIEATGTTVRPTGDAAPCCGALHTHAGLGNDARELAARVISALDGDKAILVNSAGCGAALKDYGHLLDSDEARPSRHECSTFTSGSLPILMS